VGSRERCLREGRDNVVVQIGEACKMVNFEESSAVGVVSLVVEEGECYCLQMEI
jgi:hypothetical protein